MDYVQTVLHNVWKTLSRKGGVARGRGSPKSRLPLCPWGALLLFGCGSLEVLGSETGQSPLSRACLKMVFSNAVAGASTYRIAPQSFRAQALCGGGTVRACGSRNPRALAVERISVGFENLPRGFGSETSRPDVLRHRGPADAHALAGIRKLVSLENQRFNDHVRSLALRAYATILSASRVTVASLQRGRMSIAPSSSKTASYCSAELLQVNSEPAAIAALRILEVCSVSA